MANFVYYGKTRMRGVWYVADSVAGFGAPHGPKFSQFHCFLEFDKSYVGAPGVDAPFYEESWIRPWDWVRDLSFRESIALR